MGEEEPCDTVILDELHVACYKPLEAGAPHDIDVLLSTCKQIRHHVVTEVQEGHLTRTCWVIEVNKYETKWQAYPSMIRDLNTLTLSVYWAGLASTLATRDGCFYLYEPILESLFQTLSNIPILGSHQPWMGLPFSKYSRSYRRTRGIAKIQDVYIKIHCDSERIDRSLEACANDFLSRLLHEFIRRTALDSPYLPDRHGMPIAFWSAWLYASVGSVTMSYVDGRAQRVDLDSALGAETSWCINNNNPGAPCNFLTRWNWTAQTCLRRKTNGLSTRGVKEWPSMASINRARADLPGSDHSILCQCGGTHIDDFVRLWATGTSKTGAAVEP